MNNLSMMGRLVRDAELRDINGTSALTFTVATDTGFGQNKSTMYFDCSIWGERSKTCKGFVKGQQFMLVGEFSQRAYQKKDGVNAVSNNLKVNSFEYGTPPKNNNSTTNSGDIDDFDDWN